jgi:PLP dependent protein
VPLSLEDRIRQNLEAVRSRLERTALAAGRDPAAIRIIAVCKTFGREHIAAALAAGQRDFGENRVQGGLTKIPLFTDSAARWHLVGHLQSNKVRKAAAVFAAIHSIDSPDLLARLDAAASEAGRRPEALVQVDLAGEATKHGAPPAAVPAIFQAADASRSVQIVGLMVLPPFFDDPEQARPYFRRLRQLRDDLHADGVPQEQLQHLSMGMSHDFEVAVQEGATMVRIGTAIFGERPAP